MELQKIDDDLYSLGWFKEVAQKIMYLSDDVRNITMPVLDDDRFSDEENFFGDKDITYFNPDTAKNESVTLIGHCFDVPYIDSTITDSRAFITMETTITKLEGNHIKEIELFVYAFSRKDFIHMNLEEKNKYIKKGYSGNRIDMMVSAIALAFKEHANEFGIGQVSLNPRSPIVPYEPLASFYGKRMSFIISDFYIKPKNLR
jgi:hypothetical protein